MKARNGVKEIRSELDASWTWQRGTPLVQKVACGDLNFSDHSPPVSPRQLASIPFEATGDDCWWRTELAVSSTSAVYLSAMADAAQSATPDTQLFRDVFNASPIGIAVENLEGQPLFVNPAFCSFLGFSEQELRNKHCVDFSPPEDAEKDWRLFQQLRAGVIDRYQLEKRYFRRDGSFVWGGLSISLLKSSPSPLVLAMVEDITDKKKAEEARFRHAAVIESSDDAIASGTLDGIIVSWNTGAEKIYGYTEAEAVGKPISMLVPPELPDEENKILETLKSGDRIEHFETVRVTKAGKRINVSLTILPIKDARGRTVGISGIARDITERKLAEEALRASEERLRLAQQAAHIGTFDWNIHAGVDTWTPELEALHGLPPGGFGGTQTDWENLVHPDDLQEVLQLVDEALKTGQPMTGEWRVVWPDRSVHWIAGRWQVRMNEHGEPLRMVGVNVDVTDRRRAEEALRKSEERFRLAAQAGKMYAYEWEVATDMVTRSEEHVNVLGFIDQGKQLTRQQLLARVHPDDRALFIGSVDQVTPENPTTQISYRMVLPDGSVVWLEKSARAFFDEQGRMLRVIGMVSDITERKLAEEALSSVSHRLIEAQEQERTRIARELHDDFSQRLALLAVELEQLHQNPPILSEIRRRMGGLQKQVSEIATDIQTLSHELHSSKLEYLGIAAAMRGFCKEFGEQQDVEIDLRSHDLPSRLSPEISLCLFRVLQEALHNSAKHSGVRHVEVQLWGTSDEIHLTVKDSGEGFDREAAKESRGLGLVSMQERLRLVHGELSINSQPKGGTTIHACVPFDSGSDSARAAG
jgi:PAS domain S-box-containing protein